MSGDFQVVLADLTHAARVFTREGRDLADVAEQLPSVAPGTGGKELNAKLDAVVGALQFLGQTLAARVGDHGVTLAAARDGFRDGDEDNAQLFHELMPQSYQIRGGS